MADFVQQPRAAFNPRLPSLTLRKHEVAAQAVQSAARIASVVHAVAVTLEQAVAAAAASQEMAA